MTHSDTNPTAWPVPYACTQPYHPGGSSRGQYRIYENAAGPPKSCFLDGIRWKCLFVIRSCQYKIKRLLSLFYPLLSLPSSLFRIILLLLGAIKSVIQTNFTKSAQDFIGHLSKNSVRYIYKRMQCFCWRYVKGSSFSTEGIERIVFFVNNDIQLFQLTLSDQSKKL